mmetsp:Transcript_5938/g.11104  ORF Transcript_5938/g.11104 Transcript_5938/m.11104 type:complete len:105 (+) Transcript_5938:104-418(+)
MFQKANSIRGIASMTKAAPKTQRLFSLANESGEAEISACVRTKPLGKNSKNNRTNVSAFVFGDKKAIEAAKPAVLLCSKELEFEVSVLDAVTDAIAASWLIKAA